MTRPRPFRNHCPLPGTSNLSRAPGEVSDPRNGRAGERSCHGCPVATNSRRQALKERRWGLPLPPFIAAATSTANRLRSAKILRTPPRSNTAAMASVFRATRTAIRSRLSLWSWLAAIVLSFPPPRSARLPLPKPCIECRLVPRAGRPCADRTYAEAPCDHAWARARSGPSSPRRTAIGQSAYEKKGINPPRLNQRRGALDVDAGVELPGGVDDGAGADDLLSYVGKVGGDFLVVGRRSSAACANSSLAASASGEPPLHRSPCWASQMPRSTRTSVARRRPRRKGLPDQRGVPRGALRFDLCKPQAAGRPFTRATWLTGNPRRAAPALGAPNGRP